MNKVVYISDFFVDEILGGGELNDNELLEILKKRGCRLSKRRSRQITINYLISKKKSFFIISNFVQLPEECKEYITNNCRYLIYEHDHKYLITRNPIFYKNYKAPKSHIINYDFYENAEAVLCQSGFHQDIIIKNLNLDNTINLSGNLWSEESLNLLESLCDKEKSDMCSVMNSAISHKNTHEAIKYCNYKRMNYQLIPSCAYYEFLNKMAENDKFVFFPKSPETLSRVVVEARMMGMKVITNKHVGSTHEPWFQLKGKELIKIMKERREEIPNKIFEVMNG